MIQKRLEILKSDTWVEVELYFGQGLKYNSVINKVANTTDRSLSHSNTFEIPWTKQNIDALGLNVFNPTQLANALNEKYEAKYYVDNQLLQQGFVVINNTNDGTLSLNFIDEALSLVEEWGSTTYKEFIQDEELLSNINADYISAINSMKTYSMTKTGVLTVLQNITGEDFPIAYFPNTINAIGDKFQVDADEVRNDDQFNPYQSRPLFNAQAFLNMVTEAYGYTLVKHSSVDWDKVKVTALAANGLSQGEIDEGTTDYSYPTVNYIGAHWSSYSSFLNAWSSQVGMAFPSSVGIFPDSIPDFPTAPSGSVLGLNTPASQWWTKRMIFVPDTAGGNVGTVRFYADSQSSSGITSVYVIYKDTTDSTNYIFETVTASVDNSSSTIVDFTFDKSQFDTPSDPDAGDIVGIYCLRGDFNNSSSTGMSNMTVTEEVLSSGVVTYDDYGQFEQDVVNLTYATPTKTIKEIINGILQRFGALIDINTKQKTVEIFTYGAYGDRRYTGEYEDWSNYHLEYVNPNWNTNYGNQYANKNKVGLNNPYLGNSVERYLGNQVTQSKLKEFTNDFNSQFSDITSLIVVNNTTVPYNEFSISSSDSLVEYAGDLAGMTQRRYDNSTQGTITGVKEMQNVNYSRIPRGQDYWYNLIDESVKGKPSFLLPLNVIKNLDIKKPIYVNYLNGFYIIEEIEQYEDESTPVEVSLIKLPSNWGSPSGGDSSVESISYSINVFSPMPPISYGYSAQIAFSLNNWTGTTLVWHMIETDEFGVDTGDSITTPTIDPSYSSSNYNFPIDGSENGYYRTYLIDDNGLKSIEINIEVGV